jgi:hypothetical protein
MFGIMNEDYHSYRSRFQFSAKKRKNMWCILVVGLAIVFMAISAFVLLDFLGVGLVVGVAE